MLNFLQVKKTKKTSPHGGLYTGLSGVQVSSSLCSQFQRSERFLHLTKSRIAFFPALRRYRSSFFSPDQSYLGNPMVLSPAVVSVFRILCAEPPLKIASRHERADHPRSASANATPPVTVNQCTLSAKKPKKILKTDKGTKKNSNKRKDQKKNELTTS
jgi:hypothetical protein